MAGAGEKGPIIRSGFLSTLENWIYAPTSLLPAGLMVLVTKSLYLMPQQSLADLTSGNMRELVIARFPG